MLVSGKVRVLGGALGDNRFLLYHVLLLPRHIRACDPMHQFGRTQRVAVPRLTRGAAEERETVQGEPQERVQEVARFKLHNTNAHRSGNSVPLDGDTARCRHGEYPN